jgi:hypothetical protein
VRVAAMLRRTDKSEKVLPGHREAPSNKKEEEATYQQLIKTLFVDY